MLSRYLIYSLLFFFYLFINAHCVSVDIEGPHIEKSKEVSYQSPSHFTSFEQSELDAAWKNESNGNTISYLSECNSSSDPSHEIIRDGVISSLGKYKILQQQTINFNNRQALSSLVESDVDGISTKFKIVILKKNSCIFIITYVGLSEKFQDDLDDFNKFLQGFKVP